MGRSAHRPNTLQQPTNGRLHPSEEQLRMLFDSVREYAIFSITTENIIDSWNTGAERLLGYSHYEILGQSGAIIFTPEDRWRGAVELEVHQALTTGRAEDDRWHIRKDGSRFYANGIMMALRDTAGNIRGCVKVLRDMTAHKRAEEALQQANDLLEDRVRERTAELVAANAALHTEIEERIRLEQARIALVRSLVTAQEDERRRIARDLHDQLGQNISALGLALGSLKTHLQMGTAQWDTVIQTEQLVARLNDDTSRLALELRPSNLADLGLLVALQQHIEEWSAHHRIATEIQSIGWGQERFGAEVETVLYRVTQEALTNVVKHAQAQHVSIILEQRDNTVHLTIEDDGQGFDLQAVQHRPDAHHHFGLLGMHERITLIGGTLGIETMPGHGTTLFVHIPLPAGTQEGTNAP